ncbi:hypothetical protein V1264_002085 [Littorina saxatilis]|uniref:mRNA-decapping enzyme 2 n=1 Tax=Littorina saxatilis TaxID=31220 RepID=A0AAN9C312_9CAEN
MAKPKRKGEMEIPNHIMADLCSRFVINSDGNEQHPIRIFYITEHAHWHYIDFYCNEQAELPKCNHKALTKYIFSYLPSLSHFLPKFDAMYQEWTVYKRSIPSYGGILLSPDYKHVLMVQGYTSKTSWGFPKGKVESEESGIECAVREVYEETGIDVEKQIHDAQYLDHWFSEQFTRLYIIPGIQTDSAIQPKLRKEIREYKWMPVEALPTHKNDPITKQSIGIEPNNFFKVIPFVRWVKTS